VCIYIYSSCLHGAVCMDNIDSLVCVCLPGYTGSYCEAQISPCHSHPCYEHATCTTVPGSFDFLCHCPTGYTGGMCETPVIWCTEPDLNQCVNGATCTQLSNGFKCTCTVGWSGELCDRPMVTCAYAAIMKSMTWHFTTYLYSRSCPKK